MVLQITKATDIKTSKGTYLIYAPPGMGKTSSLKYLPGKTLVLDIDRTTKVLKGCKNIDIAEVDNINTWGHWEKLVVDLYENYRGKYDNIAVDNVSELERCILSDLGRQGKNKGVPAQGDYQYMQFKLVNSLRYMKNLDCNIIWTAWETTDLYQDANGQQFNRSFPQINGKILNNVLGLCDVVGRLLINSEGERGFMLSATNSTYAKNQLDDRKGCLQSELILVGDAVATTKAVSNTTDK
ncbi:phage nucleotide-binding protein [Tissierella praeacuta]|uniref:AAA family ATPase n=1 Tax=Tissierella praeacuta TaxID=43131 RepID=UPI00104BFF88|nr:AAA family ATPase [Tissierella praeacuta]TCU67528.1 phage nucleotide-binding protein [Tissierella praeacuta]